MFKINVGLADRIIRVVLGLVVLSLFFIYPDTSWRYWTLLGIIPLASGALATCPCYSMFGLSTCPVKRA